LKTETSPGAVAHVYNPKKTEIGMEVQSQIGQKLMRFPPLNK
jgi:hypothetical protein